MLTISKQLAYYGIIAIKLLKKGDKKMKTNYIKCEGKPNCDIGRMTPTIWNILGKEYTCTIEGYDANRYGYRNHRYYYDTNKKQYRAILNYCNRDIKIKKTKTPGEIVDAWCAKLAKLTGINLVDAEAIAEAKKESKEEAIKSVRDRQNEHFSISREKLIRKMERENPLRRIKDETHAYAILAAHNRHTNSNYDTLLEQAKDMRACGEVINTKEYARNNMHIK
jgi:hypothetical protein